MFGKFSCGRRGFEEESLESGVYKCVDALLDIREKKYRCIQKSECGDCESNSKCISRKQCIDSGYLYDSDTGLRCVAAYTLKGQKFCYDPQGV